MGIRELSYQELEDDNAVVVDRHSEDNAAWDDFIRHSNNGTLFHTRRFLSYHPQDRFQDFSLCFTKSGRKIALLPAALRDSDAGKVLISHPGASMGGPVFKPNISFKDAFFVTERLMEFVQANDIRVVQITLPPLVYHFRPGNYFDFAFNEFGFTYLKREVSSVIPLDFAADDTLKAFSPESRRAARKAMKYGVEVRLSEDYAGFYQILQRNLKMRHGVKPTHSLEELLHLKRLFPEKINLFCAFHKEKMAAGVVLFECNLRVVLAFYISHDEEMQQYRAVNLLFYEVIRWCIHREFKFLDFGIFTVNMKPNWGLARFKESFGALGVFRDTLIKTV